MKTLDSRPRVVEGRLPVGIPRRDPRSRKRVSRGAERAGVWTRRPRGPAAALPPRGRRGALRLRGYRCGRQRRVAADSQTPFAPSDGKQSTPLSSTERVCDGSISAGRRVRGPRARLAAFGLQPPIPPARVGLAFPGGSRAAGPGGLTSLPPRARQAGGGGGVGGAQNRHRLLPDAAVRPALAVAHALRFLGIRQGGKRVSGSTPPPRAWMCENGPQDWSGWVGGLQLRRAAFDSPAARPQRLPSEGTSRGGSRIPAAARQSRP